MTTLWRTVAHGFYTGHAELARSTAEDCKFSFGALSPLQLGALWPLAL